MPLVQGFNLSDTKGAVDTIRIVASKSKLQRVFYGTNAAGDPQQVPLSADKLSFSFTVLPGLNRLQATIDLQGNPSDNITVEEVAAGGNNQLDQFVANPGSLIWSPMIQGN